MRFEAQILRNFTRKLGLKTLLLTTLLLGGCGDQGDDSKPRLTPPPNPTATAQIMKLYFTESDDPNLLNRSYFGVVEEDIKPPQDIKVLNVINEYCEVIGGVYYDSDTEAVQDAEHFYIEPVLPGLELDLDYKENKDLDNYKETWEINSTSTDSSASLWLDRSTNTLSPTMNSYDWLDIFIENSYDPCGEGVPNDPGNGSVY